MKDFLSRQRLQLYEFGLFYYIKRKVRACLNIDILIVVLILPLCLPLYVFLWIIYPFKRIRFGSLNESIIGHFAGNIELYLCEKDHGIQPSNSIDIFYYNGNVCNYQLLKMWKRVLSVNKIKLFHINKITAYLAKIIERMPTGGIHRITTTCSDRDILGLLEKSKIHLLFTPDEKKNAQADLHKMGVGNTQPFICLMNRDKSYKEKVNPRRDWSYHDYRNSNIKNYVLASEELAKRGYHVIRMGSEVEETMKTNNSNNIIEYAHHGFRTELLDIYLSANCHFFLNGDSGLGGIPRIFRRPIVHVNLSSLEYILSWDSNIITIPKKYWLKNEHRLMTFREMIESGASRYLHTKKFEGHGIELVENTPDEIADVAIEMDERLKGTWESTDEDEELQKKFWTLIKPSDLNKVFRSRIGTEFLRQNRELLDQK